MAVLGKWYYMHLVSIERKNGTAKIANNKNKKEKFRLRLSLYPTKRIEKWTKINSKNVASKTDEE